MDSSRSDDQDTVLEMRDVSVRFGMERGTAKVLDDTNLNIERQETLGIVGESGSGKSMCVSSLLNAVEEPGIVEGTVKYHPPEGDPIDVLSLSEEELNRFRWEEVAMVVQSAQTGFNPTMKIGAHFEETLEHHDADIEAGMERAEQLLEDVYLQPGQVMNAYPHQLSGGMKQRALIALSLILNPEVIVMDEPTAALDILMQRSIISLLYEIKEQHDLTLLFVTHDLPLVSDIADRLAVMYASEIIELGSRDDVIFNTSHPYARALLNSVPNISSDVDEMKPISGTRPDPVNVPSGCSYHPRCPLADGLCEQEDPPFHSVSEGHKTACFHWEDAADAVPIEQQPDIGEVRE